MPGKTPYGKSDYGLRPDGTLGWITPKKPKKLDKVNSPNVDLKKP